MTTIAAKNVWWCGALLAGAGALGSLAAGSAESEAQDHIVVEAARAATEIGRSDIPGRLVRLELRGEVSYDDLDLSIDSNAKVLKERVHHAARTICTDLDKMYHLHDSPQACASSAARAAMPQVDAAIAAAQEKRTASK